MGAFTFSFEHRRRVLAVALLDGVHGTEKAVLFALVARGDEDGETCPSLAVLGDESGLGRTALLAAIKRLEERGLLQVERGNGGFHVGRAGRLETERAIGSWNTYRVTLPSEVVNRAESLTPEEVSSGAHYPGEGRPCPG